MLQLRLLKEFVASIWSSAAELSRSDKSNMLWIADPTPATWPAQTCNEPAGCTTFFFTTDIIALPMIPRHTSSIPTGLTPVHLSSGIIWLVTTASFHGNSVSGNIAFSSFWLMIFKALNYDSKNIWTRNYSLIASTKIWWTSCFFCSYDFFWNKSLMILSNAISCISFIRPCKRSLSNLGLVLC